MKDANRNELTIEEAGRVAALARLKLSDKELEAARFELARVLGHFRQLETVDTSSVEPVFNPQDSVNKLREDTVNEGLEREQLMSLTEYVKDGCLTVPRTVD
jgi:aspartyl-tRNA(Asn)/glutamyl-tRNA(Gln) amidotransferase subunit C